MRIVVRSPSFGARNATAGVRMNQITIRPAVGLDLRGLYSRVRAHTEHLAAALTPEDQCVQSMPDASPAKWHRAHTTWFFEEFVLRPNLSVLRVSSTRPSGSCSTRITRPSARASRARRAGMLTRPSADAVGAYRAHVDARDGRPAFAPVRRQPISSTLGLQHEQQHQELLLTDMMHAFAQSPLTPAVLPGWREPPATEGRGALPTRRPAASSRSATSRHGFCFDNEMPRAPGVAAAVPDRRPPRAQRAIGSPSSPTAAIARRRCGCRMAGPSCRSRVGRRRSYWRETADGRGSRWGRAASRPLIPDAPVRHVSWYEADAFARWAGARLPTEFEFEHAAATLGMHEAHRPCLAMDRQRLSSLSRLSCPQPARSANTTASS